MLKRCTVEEFVKVIKPILKHYNEIHIKIFLLELNRMGVLRKNKINFILSQLTLVED
jgi:hypothetical protein